MKAKCGIIVDGPGDFASLKARFRGKYKILKTDGPRGHTARLGHMVSSERKQCRMLKAFGCTHVIVLVDFENRRLAYSDFLEDLARRFGETGWGIRVTPCSPNRMIENWYLADTEQISATKAFLKNRLAQKDYEGRDGKKALARMMKTGYTYNEVVHGPQLFVAIRLTVARKNSSSLDHFLATLSL